jgi:hypothetical protein
MRRFNFEVLYLISHGDSTKILENFRNLDLGGDNFILNHKALVDAFWVSDRHKAEYLGICALRDYGYYKATGDVNVPLDIVPEWLPLSVIKENPLVQLTDDKIILHKEK